MLTHKPELNIFFLHSVIKTNKKNLSVLCHTSNLPLTNTPNTVQTPAPILKQWVLLVVTRALTSPLQPRMRVDRETGESEREKEKKQTEAK